MRRSDIKSKNDLPKSMSEIKNIDKKSGAEAELNEEIRILQAGDERRNCCTSQSNVCCFDPAVVEQLVTVGVAQPWQQLAFIQGEISTVYGVQHQPAPATLVHVPEEEKEETKMRRSRGEEQRAAKWVNQAAMRGFRVALFSFLSFEAFKECEHRWTARDRTVIAKMERYLTESDNMKVEIEKLELLLGTEDSEVDLRFIVMNARRKKGRRPVQICSTQGQSNFSVASTLRWES